MALALALEDKQHSLFLLLNFQGTSDLYVSSILAFVLGGTVLRQNSGCWICCGHNTAALDNIKHSNAGIYCKNCTVIFYV